MTRSDVIEQRIGKLVSGFGRYVETYDQRVSFTGEQLAAHRQTIALRRQLGSVHAAASDEEFAAALRRTLFTWGIGRRASRLVSEGQFAAALRAAVPRLEELEPLTMDGADLPEDIADRLWLLINSLGVVENQAKLVAGAKTLHHLLPDLVVPMDREYTGTFFQLHLPEWQDPTSQRRIFGIVYNHFFAVARRVQPQEYGTGQGWHTSRTKILDNALIGFCKLDLVGLTAKAEDGAVNQISFDVLGLPPAKDGANSIFGAGHGYGPRVRLLLEAAWQACNEQAFVPIDAGHVSRDVVVRAPVSLLSYVRSTMGVWRRRPTTAFRSPSCVSTRWSGLRSRPGTFAPGPGGTQERSTSSRSGRPKRPWIPVPGSDSTRRPRRARGY